MNLFGPNKKSPTDNVEAPMPVMLEVARPAGEYLDELTLFVSDANGVFSRSFNTVNKVMPVVQMAADVAPVVTAPQPRLVPVEETFFDDADGARLKGAAFDRDGYVIDDVMRRELDQAADLAAAQRAVQAAQQPQVQVEAAPYADFQEVGPNVQPMGQNDAYVQNLRADVRNDQQGNNSLDVSQIMRSVEDAYTQVA